MQCVHAKSLRSRPTLWDSMDCSPPGSSVHGLLQARILESIAMPSSRGSSRSRDRTCVFCGSCIAGGFFTTEPQGSPRTVVGGSFFPWPLEPPQQPGHQGPKLGLSPSTALSCTHLGPSVWTRRTTLATSWNCRA